MHRRQSWLPFPPNPDLLRKLVDDLEGRPAAFFRERIEEVDTCLVASLEYGCALTHKFDLTFSEAVSAKFAHRQVTRWLKPFARDRHIFTFFVIAETRIARHAHVHGFCAFPFVPVPPPREMRDAFVAGGGVNGIATVDYYDYEQGRGGIKYLLEHGWPDIHVICPRQRRCNKGKCGVPKAAADEARLYAAHQRGDLFR